MFSEVFNASIVKRAQKKGLLTVRVINLREFGIGKHKVVDDRTYGGGVGMVLRIDVLDNAIQTTRLNTKTEAVILLDPKGTPYKQKMAEDLAAFKHLIFVCGHYEGVDERVRKLVDYEVSLGDFVLSGGELAAMAITESVTRLLPGALSKEEAIKIESFAKVDGKRLLEHPQYTRPQVYKNMRVPKILLSGNKAKIDQERHQQALKLTKKKRPDILK